MPYIKKELREEIEPELGALVQKLRSMEEFNSNNGRAGILNYIITDLLDSCFGPLSDAKYRDYNEAIGMLECCKLEFYRKAAAPYEDLKERENGKVLDSNWSNSRELGLHRYTQLVPRSMKDEKELEVGIFMTILKPGITAFIKANSYKLADYILINEILTSEEYAEIEHHSTVSMLKLYNKKYEDLEPAIKNAFIAKARDGLNDNFVIFIKNTWDTK